MRQLHLSTPYADNESVRCLLDDHGSSAVRQWQSGGREYLDASVPNARIGSLLAELQQSHSDTYVTISPGDVLTIRTDAGVIDSLADVSRLSPAQVFVAAMNSIGEWTGSLGYAAAAGAIVWIGLFAGSIPLLIGSMLIAPFAGPAMNAAIATAVGNGGHLRSSLNRYAGTIVTTIAVAGLMHATIGGRIVTNMMSSTANISALAVLIPLAGGAAGALNLMQSERSSLVSAAATGVLVAAALAPPAGLVGMAIAAQQWQLCASGLFLLVLQLAGINLAGTIVFWVYGLTPSTEGLDQGRGRVRIISLICSFALLAVLVWVQFSSSPGLQRSSVEQTATSRAVDVVDEIGSVRPVEFSATFTRSDIDDQNTLLVTGFVQAPPNSDLDAIESMVQQRVADAIEENANVTALVTVTAFEERTGS